MPTRALVLSLHAAAAAAPPALRLAVDPTAPSCTHARVAPAGSLCSVAAAQAAVVAALARGAGQA